MSFRESLNYAHFAGAIAGSVLKTGPGVLHSFTMNSVGATVATVTLYDGISASGTPIAVILPVASSNVIPESAIYDVRFNIGLFIQGGGATMDVTVSYE